MLQQTSVFMAGFKHLQHSPVVVPMHTGDDGVHPEEECLAN
jgi:hypothetical protein